MPLYWKMYHTKDNRDIPSLSFDGKLTEEERRWYYDDDRFRHFNNACDGDELSRRYLLDKYEEMGIERRDSP